MAPEFEGETGTCKHCGGSITVPRGGPEHLPPLPPPPRPADTVPVKEKTRAEPWPLPVQVAAFIIAPIVGGLLFAMVLSPHEAFVILGAVAAEDVVVFMLVINSLPKPANPIAVVCLSILFLFGLVVVAVGVFFAGCVIMLSGPH